MQQPYIWPKPAVLPGQGRQTVGIVNVSAPNAADYPAMYQRGLEWLTGQGYGIKVGRHTCGRRGFLAARPEELAEDLHTMLRDDTVDWIMTAGGGSNAVRLLRHLDYDLFRQAGKAFMGLSNPTVLLNALTARTGVVTFHGPAVIWDLGREEGPDPFTLRHMWEALARPRGTVTLEPEESWRWLRPGRCSGRLYGGNLFCLPQLTGTPYEPDWEGAVLFTEAFACQYHQIAYLLGHLEAAGIFDQIAGLVFGVPEQCGEEEHLPAPELDEVIMELVEPYSFPVLTGVYLGHTYRKVTMPIGGWAELDAGQNLVRVR